jgi:hypothetical protein
MFHSRYLIVAVIFALAGVGLWAAVNARGTQEVPARAVDLSTENADGAACQTRTAQKSVVPDDPQEREAFDQRYLQQWAASNAKLAEVARARASQWRGCRFVPSAQRDNTEEYARQQEAADLLTADQTVPQSRIDFFHSILSAEGFHHVGWEGAVVNVIGAPDGQWIELHVRPSMAADTGGIAFTPRTYRETWRIDDSGRLSLEKAESGGGLDGTIVD